AAADISVLTVMGTTWHFTNCTAIGPPVDAVPILSDPTYDDSAWAQGTGLFGIEPPAPAGNPDEYLPYHFSTFIPNPGAGGPLGEYFRTTFQWNSGDPAFVEIVTTNYLDDGAVFWLNGVEVMRSRVPTAADADCVTLGQNPPAEGDPVANNDIRTYPLGVLKIGLNVLVVGLRQSGTGSSDDVFGMSLTARVPVAPTNLTPLQPTNRTVQSFHSSTLTVSAVGSPAPTYQW